MRRSRRDRDQLGRTPGRRCVRRRGRDRDPGHGESARSRVRVEHLRPAWGFAAVCLLLSASDASASGGSRPRTTSARRRRSARPPMVLGSAAWRSDRAAAPTAIRFRPTTPSRTSRARSRPRLPLRPRSSPFPTGGPREDRRAYARCTWPPATALPAGRGGGRALRDPRGPALEVGPRSAATAP